MQLPKDVREKAKTHFFMGLIETEDTETHVLNIDEAIRYALGRIANDIPGTYHDMMTLGPRAVMEEVSETFMSTTRKRSRKGLEDADPATMTLEELWASMDAEIVSWSVEGQRRNEHKFVYRCTKGELRLVVQGYQKRMDANKQPRDRYQALIDKLTEAGVGDDVLIGDSLAAASINER